MANLPDVRPEQQETENSYMVFRLKGNLFCIRTQDVLMIQKMPDPITKVPAAAPCVRGTFKCYEQLYTLVDLNAFFNWTTSEEDFTVFSEMLDARKQDHVNWVNKLRQCAQDGSEFPLSKDCHKCALGLWRDHFKSDNNHIQHVLSKLDRPHEKLHSLADAALAQDEASEKALQEIEQVLKPQVLSVLDEMKIEFRQQIYREMAIILHTDDHLAITADEILNVEPLEPLNAGHTAAMQKDEIYFRGVHQRTAAQELVMELDLERLSRRLETASGVAPL